MPVELSAKAVAALPPRRTPYWVAPLLYVSKAKSPGNWLLMYASPVKGRRVWMGLGSIATVPLRQVKLEAAEYRLMIARGRCPLSERRAEQTAKRAGHTWVKGPRTFEAIAEAFIAFHKPTWSNPKHCQQWENSLRTYAYPTIGSLPIARVDVGEVMQILEPIWHEKPETARRVRGRIETVIDYAKARKWFTGENPARWKGHLDQLLPRRSRIAPVEHQAAMPWGDVPAFYARLVQEGSIGALALRYTILTALRSGAVRLATIDEIDRAGRLHIVPPEPGRKPDLNRREPLRVPLTDEALAIIEQCEARRTGPYLVSGRRAGKPIGDTAMLEKLHELAPRLTVHGFRSSFRDWCSDNSVPREVAEACLGHAVESKVEAAYARSDMLERRRAVMERWAEYVTGEVAPTEGVKRRAG